MNSMIKPLLALSSLMAAFYLSISYQYGDPGWRVTFETREAVASEGADGAKSDAPPYDLKSLAILNRVVIHIKENYVDPQRINERKMLGAAMEEVQRAVAELLVEVERDAEDVPIRLTVRIDGTTQTFELAKVGNLWQMSFKFKDIFRFVQDHLHRTDRLRDIEYAAINGMLSTLDPHSTLLRPEDYREMKLSTRGKFGGLGIVISIRDGHLTIINPIEDTPAARAKLKAGDRITQIDLDSTVNMALSDAVDLMRGDPGTKIDIWVLREGWKRPRKYTLERANIKVRSVLAKRLDGGVGLVRVRNFQNTTIDELTKALTAMGKRGKLRGLILDLRGNPGGLLDQAIKMSDLFVDSGPLVTTVGYGDKVREPKMATRSGTLRDLPVAVLTNAYSASASEIVAGALRNHHRALVIGQQTFGKGSVQVIYDNKDDSALKLTIAQYLTPGDLSIQSVGITPHIQTHPVVLEDDHTDVFVSDDELSAERDLQAHLDHASSKVSKAFKPDHVVRYLQDTELADKIADNPNELFADFEVDLARDILLATKSNNATEMLERATAVLEKCEAEQQSAIVAALGKREVDWRPLLVVEGQPAGEVTVGSDRPGDAIIAGETLTLTATVKNTGTGPFRQLRAITESENRLFAGLEFIFGNVPPGESRTWAVPVKVHRSALTRRDEVTLKFAAADAHVPTEVALKVAIAQLPRPRFALTWRVDDRARGNGDGLLQADEEADLVVEAQNVGDGKSYALLGTLRDDVTEAGRRDLFIKRGRVQQDDVNLAPGGRTTLRFGFKVKADAHDSATAILAVSDTEIREGTSEKLDLPVVTQPLQAVEVQLAPRRGGRLNLRGLYGVAKAPTVATASVAVADARCGDWFRVPTGDKTYAWIPEAEVQVVPGLAGVPDIEPVTPKGPPVIQLSDRALGTETHDDALTLDGEVLGDKVIRDLLIYVNNRKVFFQSNSGDPIERLRFSARVPLDKGVNRITLIAREDDEAASRRTVIINRAAQ